MSSSQTQGVPANAHVKRLFTVLAIVIAGAVIARFAVFPKSHGQYGFYRGDAVAVAMNNPKPLHQGEAVCAECHDEIAELHDKDVHNKVQCETCHGPGGKHVSEQADDPEVRHDGPEIRRPDSRKDCLTCHRRLVARPAAFPQIDPAEHYKMLHVKRKDTPCFKCHSPHEPLFLDTPVKQARLHPVMNQCVDCHKHEQDPALKRPDDHPVVFECKYCHGATAEDFEGRPHADFRCGICHQFYPESERAGRIVKHRDPRFCLLCHGGQDFKDDDAPPAIDWPSHREDMGDGEADKNKVCADCHREAYHLSPEAIAAESKGATP